MPKATRVRCTNHIWDPAADVYRARDGWIVKLELAGVAPDALEIQIEGSMLKIAGSRRDEMLSDVVFCQQLEITYSRFERILRFPCAIEGATIERRYKDGLLVLYLKSPIECEDDERATKQGAE